jgi:Kef-type K+ transport system membrane component KefB
MALGELHSLVLIFLIAAVAPLLCEWIPRIRLPLVVMEIILGIVLGPQVLGWAATGPTIEVLANFGLAFLFFLAGFEVDFPTIRGRPIASAALGWLMSLVVCLGVGFGLQGCGLVDSGFIVGAALSTTALGTLMPILCDARELSTRFGAYAVASGAVGNSHRSFSWRWSCPPARASGAPPWCSCSFSSRSPSLVPSSPSGIDRPG